LRQNKKAELVFDSGGSDTALVIQHVEHVEMGTLAGTVQTTEGQPIPDARVLVVWGPTHPDLAALTNESGRFQLGSLDPGRYVIEIDAEGYLATRGRVRVLPGSTRVYRIVLEDEAVPEIN
jgi:protocatechuate 3,4-dioxygenase beta subunit